MEMSRMCDFEEKAEKYRRDVGDLSSAGLSQPQRRARNARKKRMSAGNAAHAQPAHYLSRPSARDGPGLLESISQPH